MKKSQVFLKSRKIVEEMISAAGITDRDIVLEIGPGKGIITEELSKKAKKVVSIELDKKFAENLDFPNVELIIGDALKIEWPEFDKFVSNIPFHISSPLTFKLFESSWKSAVLIYQKEFAERFFAKAGEKNYSRLTLAVNFYSTPTYLRTLPPSFFSPKPKVSCSLVKLERKEPDFKADEKFWNTIKLLFQHKRKTLRAALKDASLECTLPDHLKGKRVFQCTINDFREITQSIS